MNEVVDQITEFISRTVGSVLEFILSGKTLTLIYSLRWYMFAVISGLLAVSVVSEVFGLLHFISWQSLLIAEGFVGIICLCNIISRKVSISNLTKSSQSTSTEEDDDEED